jgi:hypothetical protein
MIDLIRQDEHGAAEARFDDLPFLERIIRVGASDPESRCLRFVDPYGDTTFNQLQIPILIEELTSCRPNVVDPGLVTRLDKLLQFVSSAADRPHIYLKFIGD